MIFIFHRNTTQLVFNFNRSAIDKQTVIKAFFSPMQGCRHTNTFRCFFLINIVYFSVGIDQKLSITAEVLIEIQVFSSNVLINTLKRLTDHISVKKH